MRTASAKCLIITSGPVLINSYAHVCTISSIVCSSNRELYGVYILLMNGEILVKHMLVVEDMSYFIFLHVAPSWKPSKLYSEVWSCQLWIITKILIYNKAPLVDY